MSQNLVQHRGEPSVWEQQQQTWDGERWLAAVAAGACLIAGARRRSPAGLVLAMAGGALAWWAAASGGERHARRTILAQALPARHRAERVVDDASMSSFPASDAPAWTSSAGNGSAGDADD